MMMMQNPKTDINTLLPLMMLGDDQVDLKSLFLMTTMMQGNCHSTNEQINRQ